MPATKCGAGMDTDKHIQFNVKINGIERNMIDKLKAHYGFTSDVQLLKALVKRAFLNIT